MITGKNYDRKITVEHVQQPTSVTCVHACLSMVTGVPVEEYIKRFGDHATGEDTEAVALVEAGVFPKAVPHSGPHPFPLEGIYLVSAPQLELIRENAPTCR